MNIKIKYLLLPLLFIVTLGHALPSLPLLNTNGYTFTYNSGWGPRNAGGIASRFHQGYDYSSRTNNNGTYESRDFAAPLLSMEDGTLSSIDTTDIPVEVQAGRVALTKQSEKSKPF